MVLAFECSRAQLPDGYQQSVCRVQAGGLMVVGQLELMGR